MPSMSKEEIGKVIKDTRIAKGMTQLQVAEALGRAQNVVSAWEVGRAQPDANTLFALFDILGCSVDEAFGFSKEKFSLSANETKIIKKYRALDRHGKEMVDVVLEKETARMDATRTERSPAPAPVVEIARWSVPRQRMPMSAGTGTQAGEGDTEDLELVKRPPRGTSYVARVTGDSMEPDYRDGDLVFVRACGEIEPGQTGVFLMDGQQWIKELGDGVLVSRNPAYPPRPMMDGARCQGLVLGLCDRSYFDG